MLKDKIAKYKKIRGITNEELAELSGVPKSTLSKITAGETPNPKFDTVVAIAKALNCSLNDLSDNAAETGAESENTELKPDEAYIIETYHDLSDEGKTFLMEILAFAKEKYKKDNEYSMVEKTS